MSTKHNFDKVVKAYVKLKQDLPRIVGNEAVVFSKGNWRKQGFQDVSVQPWKRRNPKAERNSGRAILIDTGRLRRSIRITGIFGSQVHIGSDVPYARIHNDGGRVTSTQRVREHTRRTKKSTTRVSAHQRRVNFYMPRRRYIGNSVELHRRINQKVKLRLLKVFKQ